MAPNKTRFTLHCEEWKDGCGSDFCDGAMKRTFYRGSIPCDVLFCGEAPGKSENVVGQPFIGPAGKLLDGIIDRAIPKTYKVGLTNLVMCIPRAEGEEKVEPDPEQINQCRPRLEEIIQIANPKLIIAVGSHARDALTGGYLHSTKLPPTAKVMHIVHPAHILRQSQAFQGLEIQRVIGELRDAIHLLENPPKTAPKITKEELRKFGIGGFQKKKSVLSDALINTQGQKSDILDHSYDSMKPCPACGDKHGCQIPF